MTAWLCLAEQREQPALRRLPEPATLEARPLAALLADGWERPLLLLGDALTLPDAPRLVQRAYRNPAPLLIVPPLPAGDIAPLLTAPAPVAVVRQPATTLTLHANLAPFVVAALAASGASVSDSAAPQLQIFCTEAIETALLTGTLATAAGKSVIWAYRPTRAATPVVWVGAQLLLISARTAPLEREALWQGLGAWMEANTAVAAAVDSPERAPRQTDAAHALHRAIVVAYAARPELSCSMLMEWLATQLGVRADEMMLNAALDALRAEGVFDAENRPQRERLQALVTTWGLRAWVREARKADQV